MPTSFTLFIGWQVTFVCVVRSKHAEMYILHALHWFSERIECGGGDWAGYVRVDYY